MSDSFPAMPENGPPPIDVTVMPAVLIAPLTRMGENVARTSAELAAVKRDTEALRDNHHRLAQTLQESMALFRLQDQKIGFITEGHTRLSVLVERLGETTVQLSQIGTQFLAHVEACNKRGANIQKGVWMAVGLGFSAMGALLVALGVVAWTHLGGGK